MKKHSNYNLIKKSPTENFEIIVQKLIECAPCQRAIDFTNKIADQIRAKGEKWISDNALKLGVACVPPEEIAPIADNRIAIIVKFQLAL